MKNAVENKCGNNLHL